MFSFLVQNFGAVLDCSTRPLFLGIFVPWYQYLPMTKDTYADGNPFCTIDMANFHLLGANSDLPLILLAIVDDLLRLGGLVAVGYVIYGGIQYVTSQGSPDQTAKAQSTIINALVGLAIAIIAVGTVTFIGSRLVPGGRVS